MRVVKGKVLDVAVDIRPGSKTYGKHFSIILSEENKKQFWVPPGFAHGFVVLSDTADFEYKCTDFYDASDEGSILWSSVPSIIGIITSEIIKSGINLTVILRPSLPLIANLTL